MGPARRRGRPSPSWSLRHRAGRDQARCPDGFADHGATGYREPAFIVTF